MLKALIFDVDGTLADTEMAHLAAFNHAFRECALDWHWSVETYTELLAGASDHVPTRDPRDSGGGGPLG